MKLSEQAELGLRLVREAPIIAYDTETSGLDWRYNKAVGYVITADAENNVYIPVRHGGGANLYDPNVPPMTTPVDAAPIHSFERELAKAFEERRRRDFLTVGHNLKFDMHISASQGIYLGRNCEDTSINMAMLDEFMRSYNLSNCAEKMGAVAKLGDALYEHIIKTFGLSVPKGRMSSVMEHFWRLPGNDPIATDYAMGDGVSTLDLWAKQQPGLKEKDEFGRSMEAIHRVESRLIWTVFRMERRGIKTDADYIERLVEAINEELTEARLKLPPEFNARSNPQMKQLVEGAGIFDHPRTAIGNPSFTESFLKKHEIGRAVIAVRQLSNLLSTFVTPLREEHIFEGRVHASLNQIKQDDYGTISGRFSCSEPNLQAVPKRNKKLGRRFRGLFVPDEGMEFYEADYSQCEPRLFAHYSGEPALVEGYSQSPPRDMHAVVADMFSVERDPTAKRMNMGILTGMQAKTFAGHMDWPLDKAILMHKKWFQGFPGIKKFQDDAKAVFLQRGFVRTLLGRKCRLDDARFAYRATSRIIQGGNADIIKYKLLEVDEYLESIGDIVHLLMTVHDSVNWQAPIGPEGEAISAEIVRILTDVQGAPFNLKIPFIMDVGHGPSWAVATYGPENA